MALFRIVIVSETLIKDCIAKALRTVMTKAVELRNTQESAKLLTVKEKEILAPQAHICV